MIFLSACSAGVTDYPASFTPVTSAILQMSYFLFLSGFFDLSETFSVAAFVQLPGFIIGLFAFPVIFILLHLLVEKSPVMGVSY
jgi:hypothetical protein